MSGVLSHGVEPSRQNDRALWRRHSCCGLRSAHSRQIVAEFIAILNDYIDKRYSAKVQETVGA